MNGRRAAVLLVGCARIYGATSSEVSGFYSCKKCSLEAHGQCRDFGQKLHTCIGNGKLRLLHLHPPTNVMIKAALEQRGSFKVQILGISVDLSKPLNLEMKDSHLYVNLNIRGIDGVIRTDAVGPLDKEGDCMYQQNDCDVYSFLYTGVAADEKEPILHVELWKSLMVILDSCVGVEDITLATSTDGSRCTSDTEIPCSLTSPHAGVQPKTGSSRCCELTISFVPKIEGTTRVGVEKEELLGPVSSTVSENGENAWLQILLRVAGAQERVLL